MDRSAEPSTDAPNGSRPVERYLARRYLSGRRGLVSFITWIAVGGVAVGVMALIVVIGVLSGLQRDLRERILSGGPHAVTLQIGNAFRMDAWPLVLERIQADPDVVAAAPFIYTEILLSAGENYNEGVVLRGVVNDRDAISVTGVSEHLVVGDLPFVETESGHPGMVVGRGLADRLGLYVGKLVTAASIQNTPLTPTGFQPQLRRFEVTGVFQTGLYQFDTKLSFVELGEAQILLGLDDDNGVTGVEFDVRDPWQADQVAARVEEGLGYPYKVDGWQTQNANLFSALFLEKIAMAVILTLIVLVASFNIISTLVMMVGDKTREIGILRSMGLTGKGIRRVFMQMGLFIGLVGTVVGGALGGLLAWLLHRYEFITLPSNVYFIDKLPIALEPRDMLLIVVGSILISFLATLYPAAKAAKLTPVDAIRHE
jgi:lipoprotein-releasing system permease protein